MKPISLTKIPDNLTDNQHREIAEKIAKVSMLDILISVILFDYPIKGFLRKELDELCKYISSSVHIALRICHGQYMKSNVDVGLVSVSY